MSPTGIDQSWGYADPKKAYAAGVRVVSMYLSPDPSKNITSAKVKAYHKAGIAVLLNWEAQPGAPLQGASRGASDAAEAVRQVNALMAAVGYKPKNRASIYFSCDTDVNSGQYGSIDAYYANTKRVVHAAGFGNGVYAEASLVTHLHAAGLTDSEWQTIAWSYGVLSPQADFYQTGINDTLAGASVDYDRIIHADDLGAWWPPNSSHNTPSGPVPPSHPDWSDMATKAEVQAACEAAIIRQRGGIAAAVITHLVKSGVDKKNYPLWRYIQLLEKAAHKTIGK